MTLPSVAVLLPACNGASHLPVQIDSILAQHGCSVEIVISVDDSHDSTLELCTDLSSRDSRIRLLGESAGRVPNGAASNVYHLNRNINPSHFDYVALSDQDDIWLPTHLSRAIRMLTERGADAYSSDVVAFWENGKTRYVRKSQPQRTWDHLFSSPGPGCSFVFTAQFAEQLRVALTERPDAAEVVELHDWLYYAFARSSGRHWLIDNQPSLLYRQHSNNQFGVNRGWGALCDRVHRLRSGWTFQQSLAVAEFCEMTSAPPVKLMTQWNTASRIRLAANCFRLRRAIPESLVLAGAILDPFVADWRPA